MSVQADLAFRALLNVVDDYGRYDARAKMLKAALFPLREKVTEKLVLGWIGELVNEGCVEIYKVDGRAYLELPNWELYRQKSKRAKKSKYPDPPEKPSDPELFDDPRGDPGRSARARSTDDKRQAIDVGGSGGRTTAPKELNHEQLEEVVRWAERKFPKLRKLDEMVEACLLYFQGSGALKRDWAAVCKTWIRREVERGGTDGSKGPGGRDDALAAGRRYAERHGLGGLTRD